jgi:hypothetical protein
MSVLFFVIVYTLLYLNKFNVFKKSNKNKSVGGCTILKFSKFFLFGWGLFEAKKSQNGLIS